MTLGNIWQNISWHLATVGRNFYSTWRHLADLCVCVCVCLCMASNLLLYTPFHRSFRTTMSPIFSSKGKDNQLAMAPNSVDSDCVEQAAPVTMFNRLLLLLYKDQWSQ
uniref:Uncharacterized protein n=1 Tax=Eutreptiella gymnastica TaxID=73025 RepID=A0A7S4G2D6_9EUGL